MDSCTPIYNLTTADRELTDLALFRAGYTVRQRKRKDGSRTVIYLEYKKET